MRNKNILFPLLNKKIPGISPEDFFQLKIEN